MPRGVTVRALVDGGAVRLLLVEAREPADHTRVVHGLGPDAARLGAEAVVAAALHGAWLEDDEVLTLQLQGERPRCSVYADVIAGGDLRARVRPTDLRLGPNAALEGVLVAIRSEGARELYRGVSEVRGTSIEAALSEHMDSSVQADDVLRIGVTQGPGGEILGAGGLMLERLPEDPEHPSLDREAFHSRWGWLREAEIGPVLAQLAFGQLGDSTVQVLQTSTWDWRCRCTRDRVQDTLIALGPAELRDMLEQDDGAEVSCNFCETTYRFDGRDLERMLATQQE